MNPTPTTKTFEHRDQDLLDAPREGMRTTTATTVRLPPIPVAVACVSMWRVWASLIAEGRKPIETRTWPMKGPPTTLQSEPRRTTIETVGHPITLEVSGYDPNATKLPGAPTWLALHTAQSRGKKLEGECREDPEKLLPAGVVFALVLVDEVRPLVEEDARAAGIYRPDLYAWVISQVFLLRPFLSRARGFQKIGSVEGRVLRAAAHLGFMHYGPDAWKRSAPDEWPVMGWDEYANGEVGSPR